MTEAAVWRNDIARLLGYGAARPGGDSHPYAKNFVRARHRSALRGSTKGTSSRLVQNYQLDLTCADNRSANTSTYSVQAYPLDRSQGVRWFYVDQTGTIRAGRGWSGPGAPPI